MQGFIFSNVGRLANMKDEGIISTFLFNLMRPLMESANPRVIISLGISDSVPDTLRGSDIRDRG